MNAAASTVGLVDRAVAGERWYGAASVSFRSCLQSLAGPSDVRPGSPKAWRAKGPPSTQVSMPGPQKKVNGAGKTARKPLKCTGKTQVCWHSRNRLQNSDHLSFVYKKTEKDGGTSGDTFLLFDVLSLH